jgi:hypothetical protein
MSLPQEPMELVVGLSQLDWLQKFPQLGGYLREIGASVQTYLEWNKVEIAPNTWDWSYYDRQLELLQRLGLKWVLLVAHGQAYGTPAWYKASPECLYYRCVEHREETEVLSHWSPNTRHHAEELIHRLGERYPKEVFSSLLLGPSGNYGETQYPCFSGTDRWTGTYHSHYGLWAADEFAVQDFRRHLLAKYGSLDALNRAWNSHYNHLDDLVPFVLRRAPSTRAWLDQIDWYCRAIEEYTEKWIGWFKAHYPPEMLYLSIGGGGFCLAGQDFSAQAKLAAQHGVGCRITTDGTDYAWNFVNTRRLTAACRFYGARIGLEPARAIEPHGVVGRIFNAATSGAHQYHDYGYDLVKPQSLQGNPVANVPPRNPDDDPDKPGYDPRGPGYFTTLHNLRHLVQHRRPRVQVAVLNLRTYFNLTQPATFGFRSGLLTGHRAPFDFETALMWLRGMVDFDLVDERMVLDGALRRYRFLIHFFGDITERSVAAEIQRWMEEDGGLYIGTGDAIFADVEGDYYHLDALVGLSIGVGEHYGRAPLSVHHGAFLERVSKVAEQGISRTITDTSRSYFSTTQILARGRGPAIWYKINGRGGALFCIGTWREDEAILRAFLADALFRCDKLNPPISPVEYGVENQNGLYLSVVERRDGSQPELLALNFTSEPKRYEQGDIILELAPYSIGSKPL